MLAEAWDRVEVPVAAFVATPAAHVQSAPRVQDAPQSVKVPSVTFSAPVAFWKETEPMTDVRPVREWGPVVPVSVVKFATTCCLSAALRLMHPRFLASAATQKTLASKKLMSSSLCLATPVLWIN